MQYNKQNAMYKYVTEKLHREKYVYVCLKIQKREKRENVRKKFKKLDQASGFYFSGSGCDHRGIFAGLRF